MLNKVKTIFKNRFIIFSLFLFVATAISFVASFSLTNKQTATIENSTETIQSQSSSYEEDFLTLNYIPTSTTPKVSKTGWSGSGDSIDGGTPITVTGTTSSVTVTWDSSTYTYTPANGYKLYSVAVYAAGSATGTPVRTITMPTNGETFCPEDIITNYSPSANIHFQANVSEIEYHLDAYYQASDNANSYTKVAETAGNKYTVNSSIENLGSSNKLGATISNFGYWILRKGAISSNKYNGYDVTVDTNEITVSKDVNSNGVEDYGDIKVVFAYNGEIAQGYKITSLNTGSYGEIEQIDTNPLIAAKISRTYDLTITSGDGGWNNSDIISDDQKRGLVGTYSTYDENEGFGICQTETTIKIKDHSDYAYKFMDSEYNEGNNGLAFFKKDNFYSNSKITDKAETSTEGKYFVFNYGYKIIGWKIYVKYDNKFYGLQHASGAWSLTDPANSVGDWEIAISDLNKNVTDCDTVTGSNLADLSYFAEKIDLMFAGDSVSTSSLTLTMEPSWSPVSVQLKALKNAATVGSTNSDDYATQTLTYNSDYSLTQNSELNNSVGKNGKEIINYTTTSGKIIVNSGKYNYINIPHGDYDYSSGTYTLNVTAEYVDNIYKVLLTDVSGTILDPSCGYNAVSTVKNSPSYVVDATDSSNLKWEKESLTSYVGVEYSYKAVGLEQVELTDYTFTEFDANEDILIENYINNKFTTYKDAYEEGVDCDGENDFEIFNSIYSNNAYTLNEDGNIITVPSASNLYIYLANNQKYTMPVFKKDYYDLIAYESSNYYFKTSKFGNNGQSDAHTEDMHTNLTAKDTWEQSFGTTLTAHWYRKNYNLDINTFLDEETGKSFHGYVKVEIEDKIDSTESSKSGKYVVLYYNGGMQLYKHSGSTIKGLELSSHETSGDYYIKLYAGCDITITVVDQSGDPTAALVDDNFVDMVGYKYNSISSTGLEIDLDSENKSITENSTIEGYGLPSGSVIKIDAYFTQIGYDITAKLDNFEAGNIDILGSGVNVSGYNSYKLGNSSLKIGNNFEIEYNAEAGFEFKENAFTLWNRDEGNDPTALQSYEGTTDQTYSFTFDSEWLRDYYYAEFDSLCSTRDVSLDLFVNTEAIKFTFGVKIYDSYNKTIVETIDGKISSFALDTSTKEKIINISDFSLFNSYKDDNANDTIYVYTIGDGEGAVAYAVLNSRMFYVKNYLTTNNNHYTTYDFILKTQPNNSFKVISANIANMVSDYSSGVIIPDDNRNIYLMLEVRELKTITVHVVEQAEDPNGTRSTTISNKNETSNKHTVNSVTSNNDETKTIYTYMGATNTISSTYATNKYSGVEYYLDDDLSGTGEHAPLTSSNFKTSNNHALYVKYIIKTLDLEYKFTVDGEEKSKEDMSEYLTLTSDFVACFRGGSSIGLTDLKKNDEIKVKFTLNNLDYNATLYINGSPTSLSIIPITDTGMEDGVVVGYTYEFETEVLESYYNYDNILLEIALGEKPKDKIVVKFALKDSAQKIEGEPAFGDIVVYEGTTEKTDEDTNLETVTVSLIEGREVSLQLNLKAGYEYYGYQHNAYTLKTTELNEDGNTLVLCNEENLYDLDLHSGSYTIYLTKQEVKATLTNNGEYKNMYSISNERLNRVEVNGSVQTINNLFVNDVIKFETTEQDREVLDYFFYTKADGTKVWLTDNGAETGNPLFELTLTSEILESLSYENNAYLMNFGVVGTPKYQLTYTISSGEEYIAENGFDVYVNSDNTQKYTSGEFYIKGTTIHFDLTTKVPGKYKIYLTENGVLEEAVTALADKTFTLNEDIDVKIIVSPESYSVDVSENLYTNIVDLDNSNPTEVNATNQVNNLKTSGLFYNQTAVLTIDYIGGTDNRAKLYEITISGNETDNLQIKIVDGVVKYVDGNGDLVDINPSAVFNVTLNKSTNKLQITYTSVNNVSLTLNYLDYKLISGLN